jgi:hypothetical protein
MKSKIPLLLDTGGINATVPEKDDISAFAVFISGIVIGLGAIAFAELIKLFIDIERNTRTKI